MASQYPGWDAPVASALDNRLSVRTPELVAIDFPLAGIGSRFVALLADYVIQGIAAFVLILLFALLLSGTASSRVVSRAAHTTGPAEKWVIAFLILIPFLFQWGYFTLFEVLWRGQTPGKRLMHIRVIQQTGRPAGLFESMGRNLVRIIDMLPAIYIVGMICMFVTRRQQRLGDLLAGTLVVHEHSAEAVTDSVASSRTFTLASFEPAPVQPAARAGLPSDAVALLELADLQTIESYLARRLDVPVNVRRDLGDKLSAMIARKMKIAIPDGMSRETFLEEAAYALRGMAHLRSTVLPADRRPEGEKFGSGTKD